MNIREGETDAHTLYEQMADGKGVLLGVPSDMGTSVLNPVFDLLDVGDIITVYKNGTPAAELPVLAKAALNGDDQEVRYTVNGPFEVGKDGLFLYLAADIYTAFYDEPAIYKYSFDVEEECRAAVSGFLEDYVTNTDPDLNYISAEDARQDAMATRAMLRFVGGLIGIIFGAAGVLNLANTVITTILARRHEFATMQSIGMTGRQLTGMMMAESVYYAAGACLCGLLMAAVLNLTLVKGILDSQWQFTFHFTLVPALLAGTVMIPVSVLVPVLALRVFYKDSIVEQLRAAE